jgi:hypothetical protein
VTVHSLSAIHSASRPGVPISSAVGTCSSAPKKRGVKTRSGDISQSFDSPDGKRTVSLNGIVRNTAQHRKPFLRRQSKPLTHPREKVRQTVMPSLDALGNTGTATRETEGRMTVRSENDAGRGCREGLVGVEDVA